MSQKNQELKQVVVDEIRDRFSRSKGVVLVDYRGLTVEEATALRSQARAAGVEYKVLKNKLVIRALAELGITGMDEFLNGPTAFAFGYDDPVAPAKLMTEYIKKAKKMEIKAGLVDGQVINEASVQTLAELPPKEVLIARLMGSMNAPITSFVGVLSATLRSLLYALNAVKDKKEQN